MDRLKSRSQEAIGFFTFLFYQTEEEGKDMGIYEEKAVQNFLKGYNCAQSVAAAFAGICGIEEKEAVRFVSAFGGGMGRLREVCGAVSGMFFVLGILFGYDESNLEKKKELYERVQLLAERVRQAHGSIVCREILKDLKVTSDPAPSPRTAEYYAKRPCARVVGTCASVLEDYLREEGILES